MKRTLLTMALALAAMVFAGKTQAQTMFGLTSNNQIFTMADANDPSTIDGPYSISGITSGQVLVGMDIRNSNDMLYAFGYDTASHNGQLYTITGSGNAYTATAVNTIPTTLFLGSASSVGFNFVSTLDNRIRIIATDGTNYAMNADDGTIVNTGASNVAFVANDVNATTVAAIGATAYTNSYYGADAADEIGYDLDNNVWVKFAGANYYYNNNPANYPTEVYTMGTGGLVLNTNSMIGMDTWYDTITHSSTVWLSATPALASGAHLYKMDNMTWLAQDMGAIGSGSLSVRAIAWQTGRDTAMLQNPVQGQLITALTLNMRNLIFFDSHDPSYIRRLVRVNSVTGGQAMIAITYGTDQKLYGLGYNSTNKTYQLYIVDTLSGLAHTVNNMSAGSLDLGDDNSLYSNSGNINVAFNFIANTDHIRIIGNHGQTNVQLDATTGAIVEVDSPVHYNTSDVNFGQTVDIGSVAWLNNYDTNDSDNATMMGYDFNTGAMVSLNASVNDSIFTYQSMSGLLHIFGTGNSYNNGYLDIYYNDTDNTNTGFMAVNYYGDSAATENYSSFYTMNNMTATSGINAGSAAHIGGGTPVKSIAVPKEERTTAVYNVANNYNAGLLVYPNPTNGNTRIVLQNPSIAKVHVFIMDLDGRIVSTYVFPSGTTNMDISVGAMPVGLYSVRVMQDGLSDQTLKIIKD